MPDLEIKLFIGVFSFGTILNFRLPLGVLEVFPVDNTVYFWISFGPVAYLFYLLREKNM